MILEYKEDFNGVFVIKLGVIRPLPLTRRRWGGEINERKMANNILEQFEEVYSRWSMAEKVGREMKLGGMWQQLSGSYNYLYQIYQHRGYLTPEEAGYANQLSRMLAGLQTQKMRVDQELSEEMMKHLAKMIVKR